MGETIIPRRRAPLELRVGRVVNVVAFTVAEVPRERPALLVLGLVQRKERLTPGAKLGPTSPQT